MSKRTHCPVSLYLDPWGWGVRPGGMIGCKDKVAVGPNWRPDLYQRIIPALCSGLPSKPGHQPLQFGQFWTSEPVFPFVIHGRCLVEEALVEVASSSAQEWARPLERSFLCAHRDKELELAAFPVLPVSVGSGWLRIPSLAGLPFCHL